MTIKWRCTLCGECCKRYVPLVLPEDVQRIQCSLNLPLSKFLVFYRSTDFEQKVDESDERFFQTRHGKLALGLDRIEQSPDGRLGCIFLKDNKCSIYSFRPYICRQYPFRPVDYDNVAGPFRLMDNICFGNHAEDEEVDENPLRQNYIIFEEKQDAYLQRVREWNANPASSEADIEDFLSYVGLQWA